MKINNKERMMKVVRKEGVLLEFTSNKLKNDREVVMAALRNSWLALEFVSIAVRNKLDRKRKLENKAANLKQTQEWYSDEARISRAIEKRFSNKKNL